MQHNGLTYIVPVLISTLINILPKAGRADLVEGNIGQIIEDR